jgi:heme-degrading monooxygenase HmoA
MVLEITVLDVRPGTEAEFESVLPEALDLIVTAPGYCGHTVRRHSENSNRYILLVHWKRQEDSEENFRGTARHRRLKAMLHRFYELYPETNYYVPVQGFPTIT